MRMNNIKVRKPRPEEGKRISIGYEVYAKEIEDVNAKENLTLPVPNTPGPQTIKQQVEKMKKKKHGENIYLAVAPREEMGTSNNRPFGSFIKLTFAEVSFDAQSETGVFRGVWGVYLTLGVSLCVFEQFFKGERAVCIDDIYVSKQDRRHYHGSILLASALEYVLRGPHPPPKRVFKVFCCVNEQNGLAVKFFTNAGFLRLPPHGVPPRFRVMSNIVFAVNHAGLMLNKVTKALKPGLSFDKDWVTSQQLEEQRQAELKKAEDRDMAVFNKKLDAFLSEKEVPRMTKLLANVAGDPLLPLGVAEPPDPARDADRTRVLKTLERRRQAALGSMMNVRDRPKEPKYTCENDRVPESILKANGAAVLRMRELHRWKHEIEGSRVGNSKILACPDILRDAWLDELEHDARLALPDEWIKRKDGNGDPVYFNKITHKTTPNRPKRKGKIESRSANDEDADKDDDMDLDAAGFGGSVEELQRLKDEAEKKRVKERRLWEREMDQVIDKALSQSESLVSFMNRMKVYYPKEKADEITLKARQTMEANTKVQGADLNVEQAIKKGFIEGTKNLFKTPLQKSKEVKKQVQSMCAKVVEEKMQAEQEAQDAKNPADSSERPTSAQVSAAAFGSPKRQRNVFRADLHAQGSPAGASPIKENVSSPSKRAKHRDTVTKPVPLAGHTSDAAADWIQTAAEKEQAMHDADCMLEMFAPPSRVASVTSNNVPTETKTLEAASSSALSPVIESPQKRRGGGYLGDETATSSTIPSMEPSSQISRSNSAVKQRQSASRGNAVAHISLPTSIHEVHTPARPTSVTKSGMELHSTEAVAQKADVVSRPSTGMSLASTVLRPRGPPSRSTAGTSLFGLDGVSRPHSMQDGVGFGLDGDSHPIVANARVNEHVNTSSTFVPWGSNMLGLQGVSNPDSVSSTPFHGTLGALDGTSRPTSVASSSTAYRLGDVSAFSTPMTTLLGLEGISRPASRSDSRPNSRTSSRPVSSTSMRPEWNVPWRMGSAGKRSAATRTIDSSCVASSKIGLDDDSRPSSSSSYPSRPMSSVSNIRGTKASQHAEAHDVGPDPRPRRRSIAEDVPTILPSIHLSKETRNGAGGGEAKDHVSESGDVEANLTIRTGVAAAEQVRQKRPQTAAVNPKMLRFAPEAYRPQSAAITPTRAQQQQQKHL